MSRQGVRATNLVQRTGWFVGIVNYDPLRPNALLSRLKLKVQRTQLTLLLKMFGSMAKGYKSERVVVNDKAACRVYNEESSHTLLIYFHGGAYIVGSAYSYRKLVSHLANRTGISNAYVLDYRLAPEHMFPAALEDAVQFYKGVLKQTAPSTKIVFAGDSAGGNLALVTTLKLKQLGIQLPSAILLMSPWADPLSDPFRRIVKKIGFDPYDSSYFRNDPLLGPIFKIARKSNLKGFSRYYVPEEKEFLSKCVPNPLVAPVYGNLTGFPPTLVHVSEKEILKGDAISLKNTLEKCGVPVRYREFEGLFHVFQMFTHIPESLESFEDMNSFLKAYL